MSFRSFSSGAASASAKTAGKDAPAGEPKVDAAKAAPVAGPAASATDSGIAAKKP